MRNYRVPIESVTYFVLPMHLLVWMLSNVVQDVWMDTHRFVPFRYPARAYIHLCFHEIFCIRKCIL